MKECQVCKQCYPDAVTNCPQDNQPTFHSISGDPILEGKYRLEKRLGQGGMGVVYQARHNFLRTQLAIKVILPDLVGNDPELVKRFRQEALAAAAIRHHNVVQVTDYGVVDDKMPFLVMEYVEGESLHDLLAREKRLEPEKAVDLMAAICAGVGAAHRQGIVHRDLKPLNIMILKDKTTMAEAVKILDFGLAKIKSGELLGSFIQAQTTGLMGSPYYMSPEQWADDEPDAQADVYSLAVMFYQMVAGDVPFKGSSIPAIMQKHLNNPPTPFADMGVQISPALEAAVQHALTKDKNQRTQTVHKFVEELQRALGFPTQPLSTTGLTGALAASTTSIHILTVPPQAKVFIDNVAVGETLEDGYLLLEGVQSGNHRIKVSKQGFHDWENQIVCDGNTQQVNAHLQHISGYVDPAKTMIVGQGELSHSQINQTQGTSSLGTQSGLLNNSQTGIHQTTSQHNSQIGLHQTTPPHWQVTGQQSLPNIEGRNALFSPLIIAITGIFALLLLTSIGVGGGYMLGWFGTSTPDVTPTPTASPENTPPVVTKNEMVQIQGGKLKMGSNTGEPFEQPVHEVEVNSFWMDKTEVTNAEYYEFVSETNYRVPAHWVEGKPVVGKELLPVVFVSVENVEKFIEWRSKRDGVKYRLPTEGEWEYAARNGEEGSIYPWGNSPDGLKAVIEQASAISVGTVPSGANKWGVLDLIGNVWEWTATEAKPYPGNKEVTIAKTKVPYFIIRGGCFNSRLSGEKSITSASRLAVDKTRQDGLLGFRLVKDN